MIPRFKMSLENILWLLIAIALYTTVVTIYRLFFHPLAKFPGRKLAAVTQWYEFYFDIVKRPGGTFVYEIAQMHEQYGK